MEPQSMPFVMNTIIQSPCNFFGKVPLLSEHLRSSRSQMGLRNKLFCKTNHLVRLGRYKWEGKMVDPLKEKLVGHCKL